MSITPTRREIRSVITAPLLAAALLSPLAAWSQQRIPNAMLSVTVQQKEAGKIEQGFHVQELVCWDGECNLTTLTLNACVSFFDEPAAFYPLIDRKSTREGNLKVTNEGDTLVTVETGFDIGGDYVTTQRFRYAKEAAGEKYPWGATVSRLIGYSGGFVKNSELLKRILTVEYVPLQGASQRLKLDCPVILPGVETK